MLSKNGGAAYMFDTVQAQANDGTNCGRIGALDWFLSLYTVYIGRQNGPLWWLWLLFVDYQRRRRRPDTFHKRAEEEACLRGRGARKRHPGRSRTVSCSVKRQSRKKSSGLQARFSTSERDGAAAACWRPANTR